MISFILFTWFFVEIILKCKIHKKRELNLLLSCSLWSDNVYSSDSHTVGAWQIFLEWLKEYVYIWTRTRKKTQTFTVKRNDLLKWNFWTFCLLYLNCYYNIMCARNKKEILFIPCIISLWSIEATQNIFCPRNWKTERSCMKVLYTLHEYILGLFSRFHNEMNNSNSLCLLSFPTWKLPLSSDISFIILTMK